MTEEKSEKTVVEEIPVDAIKIRFRLRTPKEERIADLAESIKTLGLLNPITVDNQNYLIAGYHRLHAHKHLGLKTVPAIIKDFTRVYSELGEIDENLKVVSLDYLEMGEHIVRREELLEELGVRMKRGHNSPSDSLMSTDQLAESVGKSNRVYRFIRQIGMKVLPEVRDELKGTKFADVMMDMYKLSQQTPEVQRKVSQLLISGKCTTFKRGFIEGNIQLYRRTNAHKVDFNVKEKFGIPHSIMRFRKAKEGLQNLCDLVGKNHELEWTKREGIHFGESRIPVYGMSAEHAEFLVNYYVPEGGTILDNFVGRGTVGLASLYHDRKFIGVDIDKKNIDGIREVLEEHFPDKSEDYELHHTDGVDLEFLEGQENVLDGVITSPPYVLNAERYTKDERDLSSMNHEQFMQRINANFKILHRLIKKSDFEKKEFYPIIFIIGTGRKGTRGIIDMDFEFQQAAKDSSLILWDKVFNRLHTPFGAVNWERNYLNKYVQKNYETNLVFVKF